MPLSDSELATHTRYGSDAENMSGPFIAPDEELQFGMSQEQRERTLTVRRLRKSDGVEASVRRVVGQFHMLEEGTLVVVTKILTLRVLQQGLNTLAEVVRGLEIQTVPLDQISFMDVGISESAVDSVEVHRARSRLNLPLFLG